MRPEGSTTTPLPSRSLPRIFVDGWSRETVVWMYTTLCKRCRTSSTDASMIGLLTLQLTLQMIAEEIGDPAPRVGERAGVEGDSGAAALVRLVVIGDVGQERPLLTGHVEVVVGARVQDDPRVRAPRAHRLDHLDAGLGVRPVVGVADQHQERARHQLVDQRIAAARIEADRRAKSRLGQRDAAPPGALEARSIDRGEREHPAVRPTDDADARAIDVRSTLQVP